MLRYNGTAYLPLGNEIRTVEIHHGKALCPLLLFSDSCF